jgi:hypothetical protein
MPEEARVVCRCSERRAVIASAILTGTARRAAATFVARTAALDAKAAVASALAAAHRRLAR